MSQNECIVEDAAGKGFLWLSHLASDGESRAQKATTRHKRRNATTRHLWRISLQKQFKSAYLTSYENHSPAYR